MAHRIILPRITNLDQVFQDVQNVHPLIHGSPPADWDPVHFGRVKIWHGVTLDQNQVLTTGTEVFEDIAAGTISMRTGIKCLRLAMSLRSANPGNTQFLFRQQDRPDVATDVLSAIEQIPQIDKFGNTPYTLCAQQVIRGPVQTVRLVNTAPVQEAVVAEIPAGNDTNLQRSNAYSFIAAYLLKLLVKSDDNVVAGIINMKDRFVSFYGPSRTVSRFTLTRNQALAMKDALHSQSHIMSTFTHAIANTHQNFVDNYSNKEVRVVSYLGILPFSYTGLQSYNLMMKLKGVTKVNLDTLLSMYYCKITAPALRKIAQIARDYERTETEPQRNVTFKYCTLWAPHYFGVLRSRQSVHLLYTISCTWKHLNFHNERADPENIAATGKLSADMKRTLKRTGQIIGDSLKGRILSGARASNAYAIADNIAVEPEGEEEEGFLDTL